MQRLADFVIVPAGPGDAEALARVHVSSWRETYPGLLPQAYLSAMSVEIHAHRFQRLIFSGVELVLAAEGPRGLVGYCGGAVSGASAEVSTLYLLRKAQRHGVGRRLLSGMARVLADRGATSLRLWVLSGNTRAERFYAHLGGRSGQARQTRGWGPGFSEVPYEWPDISTLA